MLTAEYRGAKPDLKLSFPRSGQQGTKPEELFIKSKLMRNPLHVSRLILILFINRVFIVRAIICATWTRPRLI